MTRTLSSRPDTDTDALLTTARSAVLAIDQARLLGNDAVLWSAAGRLASTLAELDQVLSHSGNLPRAWNSAHPARFDS